jgi:hypothetical protein
MTRLRRSLAFLVLAALLPGCVGGAPPTFTLERVVRADTAPTASVIDFVFEGANPTKNAYPLREVTYTVRIDGQTVFQGVRSAQVTLPPNDALQFRVPAPIPYDAVGRLAGRTVRYEVSGTVAYLPPGPIAEILYDIGIQRRRVPFRDGGLLEIPPDDELPEFLRLNPDEAGAPE